MDQQTMLYAAIALAAYRYLAHLTDQLMKCQEIWWSSLDDKKIRLSWQKFVKLMVVAIGPTSVNMVSGISVLGDNIPGQLLTGLAMSGVISGIHGTGSVLLDLLRARTDYSDALTERDLRSEARMDSADARHDKKQTAANDIGSSVMSYARAVASGENPQIYFNIVQALLASQGLPEVELAVPEPADEATPSGVVAIAPGEPMPVTPPPAHSAEDVVYAVGALGDGCQLFEVVTHMESTAADVALAVHVAVRRGWMNTTRTFDGQVTLELTHFGRLQACTPPSQSTGGEIVCPEPEIPPTTPPAPPTSPPSRSSS